MNIIPNYFIITEIGTSTSRLLRSIVVDVFNVKL